jgi:hypothetical protein
MHLRKTVWLTAFVLCAALANAHATSSAHRAQVQSPPRVAVHEPKGIALTQHGLGGPRAELTRRIDASPTRVMKSSGLAGAMGGARVRILAATPQSILLPIPQLTEGQVPLSYFITANPPDAVTAYRLWSRDDGNVVAVVSFAGIPQEVQITWCSVVLMTPWSVTPDRTPTDPYRAATACVQSTSDEVATLAERLWSANRTPEDFAESIRSHVERMARQSQPQSLDAVGILASGDNTICTANANLAAALMRARGIACRSMAVIPTVSFRYQMHRIAAFAANDRWVRFDPSSVHRDIPAKPWQNIVMSRTTIEDEQVSMGFRQSMMKGCPYAQEFELLTPEITMTGQDFFWTIAKPLASFEATEDATRLAAAAWTQFLESGTLSQGQMDARTATTAAEFAALLKGHSVSSESQER